VKKTLILGVGNLLLTDDGVGVHTIRRLVESGRVPEGVQVEDGGTCGLDLLQFLEGVERLVVVDATNMRKAPGTILRMADDQVPAYLSLKTSPHEIGLPELMLTAQLTGIYPSKVVVYGVQPDSLATGIGMTPAVEAAVERVVELVLQEVSTP
jgi:hydrogenase maturation protease